MRWLARGETSIPTGTDWLHEREAARAAGMRFAKRRTEYLLRRYAGKAAVAAVLGMGEEELHRIAVLNHPTGAPYVQVDGADLRLDVSLTDRAGWAAALVAPDLELAGVDLEIAESRSPGFVRDYFTAAEQAFIGSQSEPGEAAAAANLMWSAKEAALKVLRFGLQADTRTIEIVLADFGEDASEGPGSWHPLTARRARELPPVPPQYAHLVTDPATLPLVMPGWWRRDGMFLLTVVTALPTDPPEELPGNVDLADAPVIESWRANPLA